MRLCSESEQQLCQDGMSLWKGHQAATNFAGLAQWSSMDQPLKGGPCD